MIILCLNNVAWITLPPRRGRPVFEIAQDGRMPRGKSSHGTVSATINLPYELATHVLPFLLSSF